MFRWAVAACLLAIAALTATAGAGQDDARRSQRRADPRDGSSPLIVGGAPLRRPERLPDGTLWVLSARNGKMTLSESRDLGHSWSDPRPLFDTPQGAGGGLPALDAEGEVHVVFVHGRGEGRPADTRFIDLWHARSTHGRTRWTEPKRIWEGYCGAILDFKVLSSGRLVAPFAAWKKPGEVVLPDTGSNYSTSVYSDDGGATWQLSPSKVTSPCREGYNGNNYGAIEPNILELSDGRVWMLMRAQTGFLHQSFSRDGAVWADGGPAPFHSSTGPAALVRMPSGRIVVFWNNCQLSPRVDGQGVYAGRDALHAAYSDDEGETWHGFREVYNDPFRNDSPPRKGDRGTAYPRAVAIDEHTIALATGQGDRAAMLLVDDRWLQAADRAEDFARGLENWHVWRPFGPASGFWRDRRQGPVLIDHPDKPASKSLQVRKPADEDPDTATWNFPMASSGRLTMRLMLPAGSRGVTVSLCDRFFDPLDAAGESQAIFSLAPRIEAARWRTLELNWTPTACTATIDGVAAGSLDAKHTALHGISYLRIRAEDADTPHPGVIVESVRAEAADR